MTSHMVADTSLDISQNRARKGVLRLFGFGAVFMPLDGELLCVIGCSVSAVLGSAVAVEDPEELLETSSGCNLKLALVTVF